MSHASRGPPAAIVISLERLGGYVEARTRLWPVSPARRGRGDPTRAVLACCPGRLPRPGWSVVRCEKVSGSSDPGQGAHPTALTRRSAYAVVEMGAWHCGCATSWWRLARPGCGAARARLYWRHEATTVSSRWANVLPASLSDPKQGWFSARREANRSRSDTLATAATIAQSFAGSGSGTASMALV
jgi:hypothetical protein